MKNAKKMTVAAGFISLLFAPLAQAQLTRENKTDGGAILFEVVRSAVLIEATNINFGTVTPNIEDGFSGSINVKLNCNPDDGAIDTVSPNTDTPSGTPDRVGFDNTNSQCGEIEVTARGEGTEYKLEVEVGQLIAGAGGATGTLDPTLVVINSDNDEVSGLNNIGSSAVAVSDRPESILSGETDTYKIGGRMSISSENRTGSYSGQYTVAAVVR